MSLFQFLKPYKITVTKKSDIEGQFELKPLEPGYGATIGNALRRVLLSSLEGYAMVGVRIGGINHEFSTIPGVVEDVMEIILNLKQVRFKKVVDFDIDLDKITVSLRGQEVLTAGMLQEVTSSFIVTNPDLVICHIDPSMELNMEIAVARGRGYVQAEDNKNKEIHNAQFIITDSVYTPIKNVRYEVRSTRVAQRTDYEELIITIQTDGTIHPETALKEAASILIQQLKVICDDISSFEEPNKEMMTAINEKQLRIRKVLKTPLEDLDLSVRAFNCLKSARITSLIDLVQYRSEDLMKFRNFGTKSLVEIEQVLKERGLYFGMDLSKMEEEGELKINN